MSTWSNTAKYIKITNAVKEIPMFELSSTIAGSGYIGDVIQNFGPNIEDFEISYSRFLPKVDQGYFPIMTFNDPDSRLQSFGYVCTSTGNPDEYSFSCGYKWSDGDYIYNIQNISVGPELWHKCFILPVVKYVDGDTIEWGFQAFKYNDSVQSWIIDSVHPLGFGELPIAEGIEPLIIELKTDEPYQLVDDNEDDSGYGEMDYSGDDDDFSGLPAISASGTGLCNLFKLSGSDISDLASYLWGLGSIASFLPIFANPMDCILSLGIVPVEPTTGSRTYIEVGNLVTTAQGALITNQFMAHDMGHITVGKGKFSNSFMDYSPYTKAELYLPYIGTVTLDIDEIMDSELYLNYNIDLLSGACVAELKVVKNYKYVGSSHTHTNVLYTYSGNVLTNIPITGQNFAQMFQAIVGAVATGIGGNASGAMMKNPTMQNAIQQQTVASEISSSSAMKPDIKRGGNIASSCGMMSKQKAKLILSLPKLCMTDKQGQEVGYPRYNRYQLKNLNGYTKIFEIHLSGIPCTDSERRMIQSVLTGGVIISKTAVPTQTAGNNTVLIYSQKCEDIELNKADNWTLLDTISGSWREDSIDILSPKIRLEATNDLTYSNIMKKANYVYIGDFGRYYYITKINAMSGNIFEVELSIDAPMSWLSDVLDQYAIVDRQQNSWNVYLSDSFIRTYNTPYTTVLEFNKGFTTHNFILAVAGG